MRRRRLWISFSRLCFCFRLGDSSRYFVTLPLCLRFLVSFQGPISSIKQGLKVNELFRLTADGAIGSGCVRTAGFDFFFCRYSDLVTRNLYGRISGTPSDYLHSGRHRDAQLRRHDHADFMAPWSEILRRNRGIRADAASETGGWLTTGRSA